MKYNQINVHINEYSMSLVYLYNGNGVKVKKNYLRNGRLITRQYKWINGEYVYYKVRD